ncbi:hypothetical protein Jab_2c22920 [Janthinobacterium sp. HH01]|uniref:restriction endonuclease n=1 Tax=Janthinobacterium sp. HH01 TaxID=1198452 RepID=UPI0002AEDD18|nr:restriction endonuclease [Janthinobacterium sp. HH01]ELX10205.1 hypothetical protein Jab_2c22920 [Janthinobacterium sp. HH01]
MVISFTKTVHPINFSELSGSQFERLVFATLYRMYAFKTLEWFGQSGDDGGRDIIGTRDDESGNEILVYVACANWQSFKSTKGISDINKIVKAGTIPNELIIISGGSVSADIRTKCQSHAAIKGVATTQVWSGTEFEERLRFHASSVLARFFQGEELPDEASELRILQHDPVTNTAAAQFLGRIFDRPVFHTRFQEESSLPAFRQALGDTINALNNGIRRDRESAIIERGLPRHLFTELSVKNSLAACVKSITELRTSFDNGLRTKQIKLCGCGKTDCPVFIIEPNYCDRLESERARAIEHANTAIAKLDEDASSQN